MSLDAEPYAGALATIEQVAASEPEADDVLRQTVALLHDRFDRYSFAAILFVEDGELVLGPWAGEMEEGAHVLEVPVDYEGSAVGALRVATEDPEGFAADDRPFLEQVAALVSAHCLVGWDTGGEPWPEISP
jgi:putative methionine-R-sulfoxide reductase with GAF domain